jgi:hypothetical protein
VNPPESPTLPFIQSKNNFLRSPRHRIDVSLPVAANAVFSLFDDVAHPMSTGHTARRVYWSNGYNPEFIYNQAAPLERRTELATQYRHTRV